MEIGREAPDSAACARLLEEGTALVLKAMASLARALGLRPGPLARKPVLRLDD